MTGLFNSINLQTNVTQEVQTGQTLADIFDYFRCWVFREQMMVQCPPFRSSLLLSISVPTAFTLAIVMLAPFQVNNAELLK